MSKSKCVVHDARYVFMHEHRCANAPWTVDRFCILLTRQTDFHQMNDYAQQQKSTKHNVMA